MSKVLWAVFLAGCASARPCERADAAGWSEVVRVEDEVHEAIVADGVVSEAECFEVCGGAPDEATLECEDRSDADGAAIFCAWTQAAGGADCE